MQGTDYAYTLQGWLKGINGDRLNPATDMGRDGDPSVTSNPNLLVGRDAFAMSLGYYGDADYKAIGNAWNDNTAPSIAQRPFAPIGTTGTLATEHRALYNGNIAHTVNTLQPFGLWDAMNGGQGQVLAQVYRYDQLNRLKKARAVDGLTAANDWAAVTDAAANRYRSQYEYDANGNITSVNRYDKDQNHYDGFSYKYEKLGGRVVRNRLYELHDDADAGNAYVNEPNGAKDIGYAPTITDPMDPAYFDEENPDINDDYNYGYDALGNLVRDTREQIASIEWSVAGKVKSVARTTGSGLKPLSFAYGASGQRTMKQVAADPNMDPTGYREHYIRDAQGNIMATYRYTNTGPASLKLNERPIYGSSRLGSLRAEMELHSLPAFNPQNANPVQQVDLNYELTDHLGNVCAVVTGRLLHGNGGGTPKQAELVSAQGYEPFGALLPGRNHSSSSYDYGFNGMRKDDEIYSATGTSYDFGARMYDPRVGRFLSLDPRAGDFPWQSPYAFAGNSPVRLIDDKGEGPGTVTNNSSTVIILTACGEIDMNDGWFFDTKKEIRGRIMLFPGDVFKVAQDYNASDGTTRTRGIITRHNDDGSTYDVSVDLNDVDFVDLTGSQRVLIKATGVEATTANKEHEAGEYVPNGETVPPDPKQGPNAYVPTPNKGEIKVDDGISSVTFTDEKDAKGVATGRIILDSAGATVPTTVP